jgi:diaminopimelate epimerase
MNNVESINFVKMHGLGNDFIMICEDDLQHTSITVQLIKKMSDRTLGIGCDQFIVYKKLDEALYQMDINNADGSSASLCGNALRTLTLLINEQENLTDIKIRVCNKTIDCKYLSCDNIQVNIGKASFNAPWMPNDTALLKLTNIYKINLKDVICVDVGNPHLVIFQKSIDIKECSCLAKDIERNNIFPDGININFVNVIQNNLHMKTWERGLNGFSLACGSGASASFAAAKHLGFIESSTADAHLDIGKLTLSFNKDQDIILQGPARKSFEGKYYL